MGCNEGHFPDPGRERLEEADNIVRELMDKNLSKFNLIDLFLILGLDQRFWPSRSGSDRYITEEKLHELKQIRRSVKPRRTD